MLPGMQAGLPRADGQSGTGTGCKTLLGILAAALLAVVGCFENYGRLDPSNQVDRLFEAARVLPDYHYYYAGGRNNPRALLGIRRDYTQTNRSWTPMPDVTPDILKKRVAAMTNEMGRAGETYGGAIYNPSGEQIGIWYSRSRETTIRFDADQAVSVSLPQWREEGTGRRNPFSAP
jgi:hypothetical protein